MEKFWKELKRRNRKVFGTSVSQAQVDGTEGILRACILEGVTNKHHVAYILANAARETGRYMMPIKETVYRSHRDKNPSDATVIARLDRAFAKGQLSWVKTPYWRTGFFGRGQIQITHEDNYRNFSRILGVDLVRDKARTLELGISSRIAVIGMRDGIFTGKKLSHFVFPDAVSHSWRENPRRIVNGKDGSDSEVASHYRDFLAALDAEPLWIARLGDMTVTKAPNPPSRPDIPIPRPKPSETPERSFWTTLAALIGRLFRRS